MNSTGSNLQTRERSNVNTIVFVTSLLLGSFLFTNGFYLRYFEPFLAPNDRLALLGSIILLLGTAVLLVTPPYSRRLFRLMRTRYGIMILLLFVIIHFSTFVFGAIVDQRQPILRHALVATRLYTGLLVFFWLALFCRTVQLFMALHRFVLAVGVAYAGFFIIAFIAPDLAENIYAIPLKDFQIRLDTIRFTPPAGGRVAMVYVAFYGVGRVLRLVRLSDMAWLLLYSAEAFAFFFVCMLRRHAAAILAIPIVYILFTVELRRKVMLAIVITVLGLTASVLSPPEVRKTVTDRVWWLYESVQDELSDHRRTSANIRVEAFDYYWSELERCWYLGYGYYSPDLTAKSSPLAHGQAMGFYEGDLGLAMALLMYGVQAIIWTMVLYVLLFRDLVRAKSTDQRCESIRAALAMTLLWPALTFHTFVWGYHEPFWWGLVIFMVYFLRERRCLKPTDHHGAALAFNAKSGQAMGIIKH